MKQKTRHLARRVQLALAALAPAVQFRVVDTALRAWGANDWLDAEDSLRFGLGWVLIDDQAQQYSEWPDDPDREVEWVAPEPDVLASRIARLDVVTFYHTVLPVFFEWPVLNAYAPSSFSDGYQWMKALAEWLANPVFDE